MSAPTTMQWIRHALTRIAVGSGRRTTYLATWAVHRARLIWQRATGWLGEGEGVGWVLRALVLLAAAAIARKIVTDVAAGLYHRVEDGGAPWLMYGTALCWLVSAYRAGADGWQPKRPAIPLEKPTAASEAPPPPEGADGPPAPADEEPPAPAAEQPSGPPPVSPAALAAAVRTIGTPHAQLVPLAAHLGTTTAAVRAAAARAGWPVRDVRMAGRSSAAGLRADETPPLPPTDPSPGVVGAGQPADDNDDDSQEEGGGEGIDVRRTNGGLIIYDLADTYRRRGVVGH